MRQHKLIAFSCVYDGRSSARHRTRVSVHGDVNFVGLGGASQNGVYTYPYYLTINDGPWTPMMCDDFFDRINVGDSWQANVTRLSGGDMSLTRFGVSDEVRGNGISAPAN